MEGMVWKLGSSYGIVPIFLGSFDFLSLLIDALERIWSLGVRWAAGSLYINCGNAPLAYVTYRYMILSSCYILGNAVSMKYIKDYVYGLVTLKPVSGRQGLATCRRL